MSIPVQQRTVTKREMFILSVIIFVIICWFALLPDDVMANLNNVLESVASLLVIVMAIGVLGFLLKKM